MKQINFNYKNSCLIAQSELEKLASKIVPEIEKIKTEIDKGYDSDYAFAYVPNDLDNISIVEQLVSKKQKLNSTALVVIGIGGSNLGTIAVWQAIKGKLYNNKNPKLKVYFADTVDVDHIYDIVTLVEKELRDNKNVIVNVVSKSGTTTETIAILEVFIDLLKKYKYEKFNENIVITTDKDSDLWDYAHDIDCSLLEVPKKVGGRYSVLTSVGLFPLAMLGINIKELVDGAQYISDICLQTETNNNIPAITASILNYHYKNGININDTFLFGVDLEGLGKWYRQLMGESIGKEYNLKNEKVNIGITPTVSIGSVDLHSVTQLYLAGPIDKFTTFVTIDKSRNNLKVPKIEFLEKMFSDISNVEFEKIFKAIIQGVQKAYLKKSRPFCTIGLHDKSEHQIGQFLQYKMFEIVYLGYLFEINPFDQPNVELYKTETRKILSGKSDA